MQLGNNDAAIASLTAFLASLTEVALTNGEQEDTCNNGLSQFDAHCSKTAPSSHEAGLHQGNMAVPTAKGMLGRVLQLYRSYML